MKIRTTIVSLLMVLTTMGVRAQITIGGNVYGGGNEGEVKGNATVTVHAGTLNSVYGGARVANVGGRTFVNIAGEYASEDILAKAVYGGNDISGTIGQNTAITTTVPDSLKNVVRTEADKTNPRKNAIDNTWKTFVRTGLNNGKALVAGSLFGGGNGDYDYPAPTLTDGKYHHSVYKLPRTEGDEPVITKVTDTEDRVFNVPELSKTYLEITGGCIAHIYGGGNNATVTEATVINVDNGADDLQKEAIAYSASHSDVQESNTPQKVLQYLQGMVGLTTFQSNLTSYAFNHARIYGGNNKATMSIMPTWNLQKGIIRDVYSGGNEGNMTNSFGLVLDIAPVKSDSLIISNVYGGCRRADVRPLLANGSPTPKDQIQLPFGTIGKDGNPYQAPTGLSARTFIRGGQITNVYGGNDISGRVFGGNCVGIYTSIIGDVYGGGNGSYAYTDNAELGKMDEYKDFYYNPTTVFQKEHDYNTSFDNTDENLQSVDALNIFRPNAEQVSIRLKGTEDKPTIIGGSIYVGGNSATLNPEENDSIINLKVSSYVYADKVFLGNNGANMVSNDVLQIYKNSYEGHPYSTMDLTDPSTFATYMDGCIMTTQPELLFDNKGRGDPDNYKDYTTYFGSFYCGGNVGSMRFTGSDTINVNKKVVIFDKFVGGCNSADIAAVEGYNAAYNGGVLGDADDDGNKLVLNLTDIKLQPKRWINPDNKQLGLEWNTVKDVFKTNGDTIRINHKDMTWAGDALSSMMKRRLYGGNVYGGCCESGHVEGNIVVNVNGTVVDRRGEHAVFAKAQPVATEDDPDADEDMLYGHYQYTYPATDDPDYRSGVILNEQGTDVLGKALTVFGGGKGKGTEVWGSATVNIRGGYCFQTFGGSESGVIGKPNDGTTTAADGTYDATTHTYAFNGKIFEYNAKYSTCVNLNDPNPVVPRKHVDSTDDMADVEYIYGGGFQGPVMGDSRVNLGNGRGFNAWGGACNADILGHTETYIGNIGFPYFRDYIYGGNDFGGTVMGEADFHDKIEDYDTKKVMIHGFDANNASRVPDVLKASSYMEYLKGSTTSIFGGCFGYYDYLEEYKGYSIPKLNSTFVNVRPENNDKNQIEKVFGGSEGSPGIREGDKTQNRSYVLIDIPDNMTQFRKTEIFGAGSNNGLGMSFEPSTTFGSNFNLDRASAIIDLMRGQIGNVFGGSHNEGVTRRTVVNVPAGSTIWLYTDLDLEPDVDPTDDTKFEKKYGNIFGGAYGTQILPPCDVYESNVNYHSDQAVVNGSIFGGNNNERRTLFTHINIDVPVWSRAEKAQKGYLASVFGAGQGIDTWAEHTEVNLLSGAQVYEVYGGGMMGHVLNVNSVQKYMQLYKNYPSSQIAHDDPYWNTIVKTDTNGNLVLGTDKKPVLKTGVEGTWDDYKARWTKDWNDAWTLGKYYIPTSKDDNGNYSYTDYVGNSATNFDRVIGRQELDVTTITQLQNARKFNTNVIINEGAYVANYAYGGGYGKAKKALSGDIYGTTYIALLGGTVKKDIYAAGTAGGVYDLFGVKPVGADNPYGFTASANAFVKGGTCRNLYGGGWKGNVGTGDLADPIANDVLAETHVIVGTQTGNSFLNGIPAIQRNAYGGGEGGAVYGTAHLNLNNGYIGYEYKNGEYIEKIEDETYKDKTTHQFVHNNNLEKAGCLFGGGYIDNSSVDKTKVAIYDGQVRNSAFGGGEIAAIGRGTVTKTSSGKSVTLHRPGKTLLTMYGGHVYHNVFGGGRGYDNLNNHGSLNSDGYVFGQTEVRIHGGEIGNKAELSDSVGNVFGGGDIGFVYSAYEYEEKINDKTEIKFGKGVKSGKRYNEGLSPSDPEYNYQGYYYQHVWGNDSQNENQFMHDKVKTDERQFTEDCKVLIEPHAKVINEEGVSFSEEGFGLGDYVPIEYLNLMGKKGADARWENLSDEGIIIHNAVFAGGNTSPGSTSGGGVNTPSVFGNATASIHDVYHRDLITLGTRHTGGLYGDGNLTLVDGYRELNITNYGTDYYSIKKEIDNTTYHALPEREQAYYELRYTCQLDCKDKDSTLYKKATKDAQGFTTKASTITADELHNLFLNYNEKTGVYTPTTYQGEEIMQYDEDKKEWIPKEKFWKESGVLPVYAGRLMNSIQRADFCGVWGSRMVMQGARDRVPKEPDYTNYTINRVREVSLNKKVSARQGDDFTEETPDTGEDLMHGNYFGIYNIVNHLGALTSDVSFDTVRVTTATEDQYKPTVAGQTYYQWKELHKNDRSRNNGNSHNKVALASGVYLELTTEESTGTGLYEKVWGPITGVIELDLINVSTGIGGGFVYAKNVHGTRTKSGRKNTTLTALNEGAVTKWDYNYTDPVDEQESQKEFETSGNFVHSTQTIIDDCYNTSNRYKGAENPDGSGAMPAHYWYIKGSVYVYPQLISAYTGTANAFSEKVEIPLTISAASHGSLKLLNVMPNRYAYFSSPGVPLGDGKKVVINDKEYYKNDPISYWDWYLLSNSEKKLFVEDTYVNCVACNIDGVAYAAGAYIMNEDDYSKFAAKTHTYTDANGRPIKDNDNKVASTDYIFRQSNNLSHETGYILTYDVDNPAVWNNWYTPKDSVYTKKIDTDDYNKLTTAKKDLYDDGPTYRLKSGENQVLGQREYKRGDVISKDVKANQPYEDGTEGQASFEEAFIVTKKETITETVDGVNIKRHLNVGVTVPDSIAKRLPSGSTDSAYICTSTVKLNDTEFIFKGTKMTKTEYENYKTNHASLADQIKKSVVPAYYCMKDGLYGGREYKAGKNYRGLEAWSSMSEDDRNKFEFNYDALDLLIDPDYTTAAGNAPFSEGRKYQYDGKNYDSEDDVLVERDEDGNVISGNPAGYSIAQSVDYTASYTGTDTLNVGKEIVVQRFNSVTNKYDAVTRADGKVVTDDELSREDFEALPNEKRHYAPIVVESTGKYYVVNTAFQIGSTPYAVGNTISSTTYLGLPDTEKDYVTEIEFGTVGKYYYCREAYKIEENHPVISIGNEAYAKGDTVKLGTIISEKNNTVNDITYIGYENLTNKQADFTIHGTSPTETTTLFVSRESDIRNLMQDKIITVIYQYDYEESDASGNITPVSERHVLNITIKFKNGVPIVENIEAPDIILPGDKVDLVEPHVTYDTGVLLEPGWELYETESDAESHSNAVQFNGKGFNPLDDPLYWYQHNWWVAYYISSLEAGRTYSNHVQVSVANYHDLKNVMDAKTHHYYIDNPNVYREPKIYINDYSKSNENGLDLFKKLYDLSVLEGYTLENDTIKSGDFKGHKPLGSQVKAGENLEFILRTDIDHSGSTWTPIAKDGPCFEGVLHGDGHTISGLKPATETTGSLFGKLCGSVYNLGVTGSFTGAGVADEGDGYVESCWINTTGTPDGTAYAVFGNPYSTSSWAKQIVNSYYQKGKNYKTAASDHGVAIAKTDTAFYNGEVAYDLNNFYLYKRYNDNATPGGSVNYKYWKAGEAEPVTATYAENTDLCSSGYNGLKYVEKRFADGDFVYANGKIPDDEDERYYLETVEDEEVPAYYPIWPDDYLFFGQALNYNHMEDRYHQNTPSSILRSGGRVVTSINGNRVYRAPAYFRSKELSSAYYNPYAVFAQSNAKNDTVAYRNMTAIDFTGYQEANGANGANGTYEKGLVATSGGLPARFYPPLLDDDGLADFVNIDLTKNLLVYTEEDGQTATVVGNYLSKEPEYAEDHEKYRTVAKQQTGDIHGHWVADRIAPLDHFLVDKQDFNAPIIYDFAEGKRMWYQRMPDRYMGMRKPDNTFTAINAGWEDVSLPFKAELVTTNEKGEITHFYNSSNIDSRIGHEYWLREFDGQNGTTTDDGIYTANFEYPAANSNDGSKDYTNTFLWDYYYSHNSRYDKNSDVYPEDDSLAIKAERNYYKDGHAFKNYPRLAAGTPYIIGFPGERYYEFDLSGNFQASTAKPSIPANINSPQVITFASKPGITINVSDDETGGVSNGDGYNFKPSYLNESFTAGTGTTPTYTLNGAGNSYDLVTGTETPVVTYAFRPYFQKPSSSRQTRSIIFSNNGLEQLSPDSHVVEPGILEIHAVGHNIVVTSSLKFTTDVRILNTAGLTMNTFAIRPGETIETRILNAGVYIVQDEEGKYTKKLSVK